MSSDLLPRKETRYASQCQPAAFYKSRSWLWAIVDSFSGSQIYSSRNKTRYASLFDSSGLKTSRWARNYSSGSKTRYASRFDSSGLWQRAVLDSFPASMSWIRSRPGLLPRAQFDSSGRKNCRFAIYFGLNVCVELQRYFNASVSTWWKQSSKETCGT